MLIRFFVSHHADGRVKDQVHLIAEALTEGAAIFGDEVEAVHNGSFDGVDRSVDVACCWGVMGNSKAIVNGYTAAGKRVLMFDKALIRRLGHARHGHYRIGIDGPSPLKYLMRVLRSWERWEAHRIKLEPRQRMDEGAIVYASSSQKYSDLHDLGDANDYASRVFAQVREVLSPRNKKELELVYRPKPSWTGVRRIDGTRLSEAGETAVSLLRTAQALITHGSAIAVEAIVFGVPVITLGPCCARPVAAHTIEDLRDLFWPSDSARFHWLCNLAYCQWTAEELRSGEAWGFLREELAATSNVHHAH